MSDFSIELLKHVRAKIAAVNAAYIAYETFLDMYDIETETGAARVEEARVRLGCAVMELVVFEPIIKSMTVRVS